MLVYKIVHIVYLALKSVFLLELLIYRLDRHMGALRSNFALVGEAREEGEEGEGEGEGEEEGEEEREGEGNGKLIKESDDTFTVWASGRVNCEGFLAQMKVHTQHTRTHMHVWIRTDGHCVESCMFCLSYRDNCTHTHAHVHTDKLNLMFCSYNRDKIYFLFFSPSSGPKMTQWSVTISVSHVKVF